MDEALRQALTRSLEDDGLNPCGRRVAAGTPDDDHPECESHSRDVRDAAASDLEHGAISALCDEVEQLTSGGAGDDDGLSDDGARREAPERSEAVELHAPGEAQRALDSPPPPPPPIGEQYNWPVPVVGRIERGCAHEPGRPGFVRRWAGRASMSRHALRSDGRLGNPFVIKVKRRHPVRWTRALHFACAGYRELLESGRVLAETCAGIELDGDLATAEATKLRERALTELVTDIDNGLSVELMCDCAMSHECHTEAIVVAVRNRVAEKRRE